MKNRESCKVTINRAV